MKSQASVTIKAPAENVWKAITHPDMIRQYFFGTNTVTSWQVGSPIEFRGEWQGQEYVDKGTITRFEPNKALEFTYLSSMTGLEDKPENYANITYSLTEDNGTTRLDITQDNIKNEEGVAESEKNWNMVLGGLKALVEKGTSD